MSLGKKQIYWLTFLLSIEAVLGYFTVTSGGFVYTSLFFVSSAIFVVTAGKMASNTEYTVVCPFCEGRFDDCVECNGLGVFSK